LTPWRELTMSAKRPRKEKTEEQLRSERRFAIVGWTLTALLFGLGFLTAIADEAGYHFLSPRVIAIIFAAYFALGTFYTMFLNVGYCGEVSGIGFGLVRREERPIAYWLLWLFPIAVALGVNVLLWLVLLGIIPLEIRE